MKTKLFNLLALLCIGGLFFCVQSCTKKDSRLSSPVSSVHASPRAKGANWVDGEPIVTGYYKFMNPNSNKILMLAGTMPTANGTLAVQWDYIMRNDQTWAVTDLGNGYFSIKNAYSGKSLDVPNGAATQGLQLQQWDYSGVNSQQWKIEHIGLGAYKITNRATNMVVTVDGGSTALGAKITETTWGTSCCSSQVWVPAQVAYKDVAATGFFQRQSGWVTGDGGQSIPLTDGRVFWVFSDSGIDHYDVATGTVPCNFISVNNCGMLQPVNNWTWTSTSTLLGTGSPASLFKSNTTTGYYDWQGAGFQQGSNVYVSLNEQNGSGTQACKMAVMSFPAMTVSSYATVSDLDVAGKHQLFGINGFVKNTDGYTYAYGVRGVSGLEHHIVVARFPQGSPTGAWTYWSGSAWVSSPTQAGYIGDAGFNGGYNIVKVNNKFVMTFALSLDCTAGNTVIQATTSSSPTGPFTNLKTIYNIPDIKQGYYPVFYLAVAHPEYINANNELLITYSVNGYGTCVPSCVNGQHDPNDSRIKAFRIPLSLIDPTL